MFSEGRISKFLKHIKRKKVDFIYALNYEHIRLNKEDITEDKIDTVIVFVNDLELHRYGVINTVTIKEKTFNVVFDEKITYIGVRIEDCDWHDKDAINIVQRHFDNADIIKLFMADEDYLTIAEKVTDEELIESFTESLKREREKIKNYIEQYQQQKKKYIEYAMDCTKRISEYQAQCAHQYVIDDIVAKLKSELKNIREHKATKSVTFDEGRIIIDTNDLYMTEPYTKRRYYLGQMNLSIDISNGEILIININNKRYNYWGEDGNHPHVDNYGDACFGNADSQLMQYITEKEYYAVYMTLLSFLRTCNIDDPAGYHVSEWDEVDENGNIKVEGHTPTRNEYDGYGDTSEGGGECIECPICGEEFEEGAGIICEGCEDEFCEGCVRLTVDDTYVCDNCINNGDYVYCEECGRYVRTDLAFDEDGYYYCPDCWHNLFDDREVEEDDE